MVNFKLRISSNFTDFTIIFCFSILASYAGHSSGTLTQFYFVILC